MSHCEGALASWRILESIFKKVDAGACQMNVYWHCHSKHLSYTM